MLTSSELLKRLKKTLLPGFFVLTIGYILCILFYPEIQVRWGLVFGFFVGYLNIAVMMFLIAKILTTQNTKNILGLSALLVVKVLALFVFVGLGSSVLGLNLFSIAIGYVSVLFVVVLSLGLGYGTSASKA